MKTQASARPMLNRFGSGGSSEGSTASTPIVAIGGVVVMAMSPSSGQVRRVGSGEPVLDEGDDHQDEQQRDRHRGGITELESPERDVVDVVLEHPRRVDRARRGWRWRPCRTPGTNPPP